MNSCPPGDLRPARLDDIAVIDAWLPRDGDTATLFRSWRRTLRNYERGRLLVWEDEQTRLPVAYCWGSLNNSEDCIMEVAPAWRRRGIGRALAERLIEQSMMADELLLEVECATDVSAPFWAALGFSVEDWSPYANSERIARRALAPVQALPDGPRVAVAVRFVRYDGRRGESADALALWSGHGAKAPDGSVVLPLKIACFELGEGQSVAVEITIDGCLVHFGKAKHATAYGVRHCENGYWIGTVTQPAARHGA